MNDRPLHRIFKVPLLILLLMVLSRAEISAQSKTDSLLRIDLGIDANAWQFSGNPIFLSNAKVPSFAKVGANANYLTGNFRRPQDFQKGRRIGFGATGLSKTGDWWFFGSFDYRKSYKDSIRYSNVARHYDGNPFITADAVGGNWRGDGLEAGLQIVLPKMKNWQTAIALDYGTEQHSRDNDPKPLNRLLNYAIQPSVAYTFNDKHTVSLLAGYSFSDETVETGYYADQNPVIYSIRGYGEFSAGPVVTSERFTKGYGFNLGADYRYLGKGEMLLGARFAYRTQDVNEGVAKPVFIGGYDETRGEAFISYRREGKNNGWMARAKGWFRDGTGFDPVFNSINPAFYFSGLDAKLAYWKNTGKQQLVQFALYPGISYTNFFEGIAKTDWTSVMLHQDAGLSVVTRPTTKMTIAGELRAGYHFNIEKDVVINRPSVLSPILVTPYYQYASSNYFNGTVQLSATYQARAVAYQFIGGFNIRKADGLGNRSTSNISFNLIF